MNKGYFLSLAEFRKTELVTPRFFRIKKVMIGIITVRINMGRILPLCISRGLYFGVVKK
jgi:hypothetical protein